MHKAHLDNFAIDPPDKAVSDFTPEDHMKAQSAFEQAFAKLMNRDQALNAPPIDSQAHAVFDFASDGRIEAQTDSDDNFAKAEGD